MIQFITFPYKTPSDHHHPRRCQLPVAVPAPAVDAAAAQQGTRVITSRGEGHDSWVRWRRHRGMKFIWVYAGEAIRMP